MNNNDIAITPLGKVQYAGQPFEYKTVKIESNMIVDDMADSPEVTFNRGEIVNLFSITVFNDKKGNYTAFGLQQQMPEEDSFVPINIKDYNSYIEDGTLVEIIGPD